MLESRQSYSYWDECNDFLEEGAVENGKPMKAAELRSLVVEKLGSIGMPSEFGILRTEDGDKDIAWECTVRFDARLENMLGSYTVPVFMPAYRTSDGGLYAMLSYKLYSLKHDAGKLCRELFAKGVTGQTRATHMML